MEFANFIKAERTKRFSSCRSFHKEAGLSFSSENYRLIETGKSNPSIRAALEILGALDPSLKKAGLYAWVRDQMPDRETKAYFTHFHTAPSRSSHQLSSDKSLVINRMQAKLLVQNPLYWEIIVHLSIFWDHGITCSINDLSQKFKLPLKEIRTHVAALYEHGIIERQLKAQPEYYAKPWIFIPYEDEFMRLRDVNFQHAVKKFNLDESDSKFRTTITRPMTALQRKELEAAVVAFTNYVVDLPDETPPEKSELCTIGIFSSVRRFGNA